VNPHIFLSVIIPVYNTEKYLAECVESVLQQDIPDMEIILVDDGSTDDSGAVCDGFAGHKNVMVFHTKNYGVSAARNTGLWEAQGEYVLFVDSDDYLIPGSLQGIMKRLEDCQYPDVLFLSMSVLKDGMVKPYRTADFGELRDQQLLHKMINSANFNPSPSGKLIKRAVLDDKNIQFPEGMRTEDIPWTFELLSAAETFGSHPESHYVYRQHGESWSNNLSNRGSIVKDLIEIIKTWSKKDRIFYPQLAYQYSIIMGHYYFLPRSERKIYLDDIMHISWILDYGRDRKTIGVRFLRNLLGFFLAAFVMNRYMRRKQ
jgi:glycosyltransferase involved in cell wall biosynthesis